MKKIELSDLMNILEYEKVRDAYRKDILEYKKHRRLSVGPHITVTFENRKTMKFQIQEMMRAERMVRDEQIQEEIDIYNSLLPDRDSLSATLFIEVTEEAQIRPILDRFIGLTTRDHLYLRIGEEKVFATFEAGREEEDRISSVHYLQFQLGAKMKKSFGVADGPVYLGIHYRDYEFEIELSGEERSSLAQDLYASDTE